MLLHASGDEHRSNSDHNRLSSRQSRHGQLNSSGEDLISRARRLFSDKTSFDLEYSFDEIERILLLLLACSVSGGDRKDIHIEHLTRLNESIQQSLMPHIEELTDDINTILQPQEYFFDDIFNTSSDKRVRCLFMNLINLINERDHYFEEILELEQDKETLKQKLEVYQSSSSNLINIGAGMSNLHSTPSQTSLNTFLNELEMKNPGIEITEYKTKMRQMKSDMYVSFSGCFLSLSRRSF